MEMNAIPKDLFFTKNDPSDPRLGEWPQKSPKTGIHFHILGYPDDEGVQLSKGRAGAKEAPDRIRKYFYKLTPDPRVAKNFSITENGNLPMDGSLAERHERGRHYVKKILEKNDYWISLGGGHDYGYCDASAFAEHFMDKKPLVVNFDAHLDVRPSTTHLHSGTPFFRLMSEFSESLNFIEFGLQPQCNSPHHTQWLMDKGGKIVWRDDIRDVGVTETLLKVVPLSIQPGFISIDIDGLSSAIAPGCSQSWASGLEWEEFIDAFDFLMESFDVRGLGIYEVAPPLDIDDQTSKLAALIMHRFIFNTLKKSP